MDLAQISQVDNALLQACLEGNEDALAHAVRHGALATRARDAMGATPLHMACLGGHLDIAAWCADQGLDVTTADAQGALPLHTACFNGHLDVARWLTTKAKTSRKEALNQPDLQGGTPLHHAALGGSLKLCRWLLFHGADERATTVDGLTPERVAMEAGEGSQKIVTLLRCHATHLQATEPDRPPFSVAKAAPAEPTAADAAVDADELEAVAQAEREAEAFRRDETARLLAEEDARRQAQEVAAAKLVATQVEAAEQAQKAAPAATKPADDGWLRQYQADQAKKEAERAAAAPTQPTPAPASQEAAPSRFDVRAPAVVPFSNADEAPVQEAPAPKPLKKLDDDEPPQVVAAPEPAPAPSPKKREPSRSPSQERKRRRRTGRRRRDDSDSDGSRDRHRRRRRRRDRSRSRSPEPYNPRRGPPRHQRGPSPASRAAMKQIAEAAKQGTVSGVAASGMYGRGPPK